MENNGYVPDEDNAPPFAITRYASGNILTSADLVKVKSRKALLQSPVFYKKILLMLFIMFIALLIGIIVLADRYTKEKKNQKICVSDECLKSAVHIKLAMDMTVDPCDDFYKYACGRWSDEHANHGWYPKYSNFHVISERIMFALQKFFKENSSLLEPLPVRQSRDFFQSCMDTITLNKLGFFSLLKYLNEVDLPIIPNFFNYTAEESGNFTFDWIKADVNVKKVFAMDVLIGVNVGADQLNRSNNILYLGLPSRSSPLPRFHLMNHDFMNTKIVWTASESLVGNGTSEGNYKQRVRKSRERITDYVIRKILQNASAIPENKSVEEAVEIILNVSDALSDIHFNISFVNNQLRSFKLKEVQNFTDEYLISNNEEPVMVWEPYLKYLFEDTGVSLDLDGSDIVYMTFPGEMEYLKNVVLYLLQTPDIYIELFMWFTTVFAMIMNTTTDVSQYISRQRIHHSSSNPVIRTRAFFCAEYVTNFMGMAVSYGIADRMFMENTEPKVQQMLHAIKQAFVERVEDIDWMDRETKKETIAKSDEMLTFIGFPSWLFARGAIESYYKDVKIDKGKYLENMMELVKMYVPYKLRSLRENNERTWRTDPIEVNAYNYFSDNSINVPLAILSFPMYHLGLEVLNYGAIGSILGHELTHGFDSIGRKFDKNGNFVKWWNNKTIEMFEDLAKCYVDQFENFTLPNVGEHVRGEQTLSENLADSGGLHHSYRAYENYVKQYGEEPHLPGFQNYTYRQLFFIAFASVWCETATAEQLRDQIQGDVHSPSIARVIGTLQNSREFAETFSCPIGSKMNPFRPRCRIW